jgi:hypothetical protein
MALSVQAPNNPIHITGVTVAHPATLTNLLPATKPAAAPASSGGGGGGGGIVYGGGGGGYTPPQVYAPALDLNALYSRAGATAANNVNPFYTKQLNDFVAQQATARQQQQQQTDTNIKNLQDALAQTLETNATTGTRTTEDTATQEAQNAVTADQRQQDQGTAFDAARANEATALANSGLTGSGLGAKQQTTSEQLHATTESRQAQADQNAKNSLELSKARTFEDLGQSNKYATTGEAKGEAQAKFDLNKFITGQTADLQNTQNSLEQQRLQALATEQRNQAKIALNNFIQGISNPAQRQAAYATYGSAF